MAFSATRSLASLNLANNHLGDEGAKVIAAMLKVRKNTACDLHFAWFCVWLVTGLPVVVQSASRSFSSLDISKNNLQAEGAKFIAEVLLKW
jgi:hypothetical protein